MSDSFTSPASAPMIDERFGAVDPQVGRYSGVKDCHIVVSAELAYLGSI